MFGQKVLEVVVKAGIPLGTNVIAGQGAFPALRLNDEMIVLRHKDHPLLRGRPEPVYPFRTMGVFVLFLSSSGD